MHTLRVILGLILFGLLVNVATSQTTDNEPYFLQEPGINPFRKYEVAENETIDPYSGVMQHEYVDLVVPGNGGMDIVIRRSYSTARIDSGEFSNAAGIGWRMHFGRMLKSSTSFCDATNWNNQGDNPMIELSDGRIEMLYREDTANVVTPAGTTFVSKTGWIAKCSTAPIIGVPTSSIVTALEAISPDGVTYIFTRMGYPENGMAVAHPSKIIDRNGNTLLFTYQDNTMKGYTLLTSVTAQDAGASITDGRRVDYEYAFESDGISKPRLVSVASGGKKWTYSYTLEQGDVLFPQYHMTEARSPTTNPIKYQYAYIPQTTSGGEVGAQRMKTFTGPHGGLVTYSYLQATLPLQPILISIKEKTLSNGTRWRYTYLRNSTSDRTEIVSDNNDLSAVSTKVHEFFGHSSTTGGSRWMMGLPKRVQVYDRTIQDGVLLQDEVSEWSGRIISTEDYGRKFMGVDPNILAPNMNKKTVTRDGTAYTTTFSSHDPLGNPGKIDEVGNDTTRDVLSRTLTYFDPTVAGNVWLVGRQKDETITGVGTIARTFDTKGNLLTETKYGVKTTFAYYITGDLKTITDNLNRVTTLSSYKRGIPQTELKPESITIARVVSDTGTVASQTNGRGFKTTFTYDDANRLTGIVPPRPGSSSVAIAYSSGSNGILSRQVTRGGVVKTDLYDNFGRVEKSESKDTGTGAAIAVTRQYDLFNRLIFESYPNSTEGHSFVYDGLNRVVRQAHADLTSKRITYSPSNELTVADERNKQTTFRYRSFGNPDQRALMDTLAPEGITINVTRNKLDMMLSATEGGFTQSWTYDTRFFPLTYAHPEVGTTTYVTDGVGNVTRKTLAGKTTNLVYDKLNRLVTIDYPVGTPDIKYSYNKNSAITYSENGTVMKSYSYDESDNLSTETHIVAGSPNLGLSYSYNALDHLQRITYPAGRTVDYAPDALGRPTKVGTYATGVTYHPSGSLQRFTYGNGVVSEVTLDNRLRPDVIKATRGVGGPAVLQHDYGYDEVSNVTSWVNLLDGSFTHTMSYDGVDRLTGVTGGALVAGTLGYDTHGNIITKNVGGTNLTYTIGAATNRLQSISGTKSYVFTYDAYGNVTGNGTNSFTYDDQSNLRCVNCSGGAAVSYDYDADRQREREVSGSVITYYLYARNGNLMYEYSPVDNLAREHVYLGTQRVATVARNDTVLDTDNDGMSDAFETQAGNLNPFNNTDASADYDADGLTNLKEYQSGSNPNKADTDSDGLTDAQEVLTYGTNPSLSDTDGDGVSDKVEVDSGRNPNVNEAAVLVPIIQLLLN